MEQNISLQSIITVVKIFSNKWTFMIIFELCSGPKRFNQLRKALNVNTKSLTDTLKHLVANGVISRNVYPTVPITVEYALTDQGRDFDKVLNSMSVWQEKWI